MEATIRDEVSGAEAPHTVSETATAAGLLHEACALFGRGVLDSALVVDGAVVCTGVVGGVSGGEASVGSLGVHSDSRLVLCRSRDRVLDVVASWRESRGVHAGSLPEWAWDDKTVVLAAVPRFNYALQFSSERLKDDKELVRAAVAHFGDALVHVNKRLKDDKEVVLAAVARHGESLWIASSRLRGDKEVVLAAVAQAGRALEHAGSNMKDDKEVVLTAVSRTISALQFASDALRADPEVVAKVSALCVL